MVSLGLGHQLSALSAFLTLESVFSFIEWDLRHQLSADKSNYVISNYETEIGWIANSYTPS